MLQKQAKVNFRKYYAVSLIQVACIFLLSVVFLVLLFQELLSPFPGVLLYFVCVLAIPYLTRPIVLRAQKKYVSDVLNEELNVPLFLEIVRRAGKTDPYGIWQIEALFAEGRYADMVSFCTKQLQNPYAKGARSSYFFYLENAYFQLGDDEKLRTAFEATERFLLGAKKSKKLREKMPIHAFYAVYLNRDLDGCETYFQTVPPPNRFSAVSRLILRARVAQLRGNTEEAAKLLVQVLTEEPGTSMAVTAKAHLAAIERGEGYDKAFPEALPDPLFPIITTVKRYKIFSAVLWGVVGLLLLLMLVGDLRDRQREAEYDALLEEVRAIIEVEYDGVTVLDYASLVASGDWLDNVALCTTDDGFALVALYYHGSNPDEKLCEPLVTLSEEDFSEDAYPYRVFEGCTEAYYGACTFFACKEDVPGDAYLVSPVTIQGRELWFAVVYVGEEPPQN